MSMELGRISDIERLDGVPDPVLGFGKDGYVKATQFSKLNAKAGLQVYALPAEFDVATYNEVYVWCAKFGVPLGVAKRDKN